MKISHIEHLGIAVKSIEEALPYYEKVLGLTCYNIETVEDQKVKTAFLRPVRTVPSPVSLKSEAWASTTLPSPSKTEWQTPWQKPRGRAYA